PHLKKNSFPTRRSSDLAEEIKKIQVQYPKVVKACFHYTNQGIGQALRTGYNAGIKENICAVPADGQFDVAELIPYLNVPEKTFRSEEHTSELQSRFDLV